MITIYHNPRCSKSREGLHFLEELGLSYKIVKYFDDPFTEETLKKLIKKLHIAPIELVRTKETEWKELFAGKKLSDTEVIKAMVAHPKLIERPIVVYGDKAVIARPFEKIKELL